MALSVNTNSAALIALENLNNTQSQLTTAQTEISTGLKVATAQDNAAVWAIAQGQRADIGALDSVVQSLNRGTSIADVASTAGQSISDLLTKLKATVISAEDTSLDSSSRVALNNDFKSTISQIQDVINNASFNGANLLNGSTTGINFLTNSDGSNSITLSAINLTFGGSVITFSTGSSILSTTAATSVLTLVNATLSNVDNALGQLGSQQTAISAQTTFVGKLQDTLTTGVGNLVDANLASESAKLQALQVQQQLGVQALSIANQAPQVILSLFK